MRVVVGTCPPVMADPNIPPLLPATELEAVAEFPDLSNDVVWQSFAKLSTLKLLPLLLSILLFPLYILPEMGLTLLNLDLTVVGTSTRHMDCGRIIKKRTSQSQSIS